MLIHPFQEKAVKDLQSPGTRKVIITPYGVGAREIMAKACAEYKKNLVIAPISLQTEWMRHPEISTFISAHYGPDNFYGLERQDLCIIEYPHITKRRLDVIREMQTRSIRVWVRLFNPIQKDITLMNSLGYKTVEVTPSEKDINDSAPGINPRPRKLSES